MAVAYSFGDALVTFDELVERVADPGYAAFVDAIGTDEKVELAFSTATVNTANMAVENLDGEIIQPKKIGIGKPLTVFLRHIYTGKYGRKDLLVTSAIKGIGTTKAQVEAVNLVIDKDEVPKNSNLHTFPATAKGTPVVFYEKALTAHDSNVTVTLDLDDFQDDWLELAGHGLSAAAKIPLLAGAKPFLLAGSLALPAIGKLLESIFEKRFFFRETQAIHFTLPGSNKAKEGPLLVMDLDHMQAIGVGTEYKLSPRGELVATSGGTAYGGDYPYVVLMLDGTERDEDLGDFQVSAVTSEILQDFRPEREATFQVDRLVELAGVHSDYVYRTRADRKDKLLKDNPDASEEQKKKWKEERDANMANVRRDEMKVEYPKD